MRKLTVLLTLLLALCLCVPALAQEYTISGVGAVTLPDAYTIDDTSYAGDNTDTSMWKFFAGDGTMMLDCYLDWLDEYARESLFDYDDTQMQDYIDDTISAYTDAVTSITYVETVRAGDVPFAVYVLTDDRGAYYYAETIAGGWCTSFAYYSETDPALPTEHLGELRDILSSFQPAL